MGFPQFTHRVTFSPADGSGMETWDVTLIQDPKIKSRFIVTRNDGGLPWIYNNAIQFDMEPHAWVQHLWDKQGMPAGRVTLAKLSKR